jgi:hypothetical protein
MQKVLLDTPLTATLEGATHEVELCDPSGRRIGYFVPPEVHEMVYAWANSLFDQPHELDPKNAASGGMTTREAIAHVEEVARRHQRKQP